MKLTKLDLYCCSEITGAKYEECEYVTDELYEKIYDDLRDTPIKLELDGENAENEADIYVNEVAINEEIVNFDLYSNYGGVLSSTLKEICEKHNIDWKKEREKIKEFILNSNYKEELTIEFNKADKEKIIKILENNNIQYYTE